ncbi:MAG: hypothetical protein AUJ98_03500 [Bacteroidetes bacterium CG2_30_33_31]|nr:MAG: hypothetical protein AUJ98_03500 [Bacteroidetes bacterium CG2_30_33_31]
MNKLKLVVAGFLIFLLFENSSVFSQSNEINFEENFSGVKTSAGVKILLIQSDSNYVRLIPSSADITKLKMYVKNNVLFISNNGRIDEDAVLFVFAHEFNSLTANGASDITNKDILSGKIIFIENSGASDIQLNLNYNLAKIKSSGASDITLVGKVDSLIANISGASDLKAFELNNTYAKINASGASDAQLNTDSTIVASISGASSIKFSKEPAHKEIDADGTATSEVQTTWIDADGKDFSVENGKDTVKIKFNNNELIVIEDGENTRVLKRKIEPTKAKQKQKFSGNWSGLELGINGFATRNFDLNMPTGYQFLELNYPKSTNFNFNFFQQSVNLIGNKFGLVTGMGLKWNNYQFNSKNTILNSDSATINGIYDLTAGRTYTKSKLTSLYLVVPLIFEFQTNSKHNSNSFHVGAGVIGGVRLSSHTKQLYYSDGSGKNKPKVFDDFYLQPFSLDATARIGWGPLNLYANYSLVQMFRAGKGPELYPFSIGLIMPFS